jgi:hypothetical protein
MPYFSVAVTKYGWTAKNKDSGKILTGELESMPDDVYREIGHRLPLHRTSIASAATLYFLETSEFASWHRVMVQRLL